MMFFKIEQQFVSKVDPTLTAEVVQVLDEGQEAFFEVRKDGVLQRGCFGAYGKFVENWAVVQE
jgi:hypothetical protein